MRDPWGRRIDVFDVIALVRALLTLGDPPETYRFGVGFLKGIRVLGVVFFPPAAIFTFFTGWALGGGRWRELGGPYRGGR